MSLVARTSAVLALTLILAIGATAVLWSRPAPASASVAGTVCTLGGWFSGLVGKACTLATHAGQVIDAGKKAATGHLGEAIGDLTGSAGKTVARAAGLAAVAAAVVGGAQYALKLTVAAIGRSTDPDVTAGWFSASYWRMAAVAALLTVPFLLAAAIQAMLRSDLTLLLRAAFGYLPLGMLAVGIAGPVVALLLAGSDEMSAIVSSASGHAGASFLGRVSGLGGLISAGSGSLFVSFFIALFTTAAAIALWLELLIRQAAVYVIVLMLPLFFAAMVWPARRIWAARAVELLIALILSKFAVVAVLGLGGAALGHALIPGIGSFLAGTTLVLLAAFSPWAMLRLLPLHELAGAALGGLRTPASMPPLDAAGRGHGATSATEDVAASITGRLHGFSARSGTDGAVHDDVAGAATARATAPDDAGEGAEGAPGSAGGANGSAQANGAGYANGSVSTNETAPPAPTASQPASAGAPPMPDVEEDAFGSTVRRGPLPDEIESLSLDRSALDIHGPYLSGPLPEPGVAPADPPLGPVEPPPGPVEPPPGPVEPPLGPVEPPLGPVEPPPGPIDHPHDGGRGGGAR